MSVIKTILSFVPSDHRVLTELYNTSKDRIDKIIIGTYNVIPFSSALV